MPTKPTEGNPIHIFYCYAREDQRLRDALERHLSILIKQKQIMTWYDRKISPGTEWKHEINVHLNTAHLILLLISPDFMASDYCYGIEMETALKRHDEGTARVVPIILRPVLWERAPFSKLQALPTNIVPVTLWSNEDAAFLDITKHIDQVVTDLQNSPVFKRTQQGPGNTHNPPYTVAPNPGNQRDPGSATTLNNRGYELNELHRYDEALVALNEAIRRDPNNAFAYNNRGYALNGLKRYIEALDDFNQAIRLDPTNASAYNNKGHALNERKRYSEALIAFESAIRLDPRNVSAYNGKGYVLNELQRYEDALVALNEAIRLDSTNASAYNNKGYALNELKRYSEALIALNQAIKLDPNNASAYNNKGYALDGLGKYAEARQAYGKGQSA